MVGISITFPQNATVNGIDTLVFTVVNNTESSFPVKSGGEGEKENDLSLAETKDEVIVPCKLEQKGILNYDCVADLTKTKKMILRLSSLNITAKDDTEIQYTVSSSSPIICVNCDFCLNENSANIFLTRVDFDKEEPDDKKKLFRQYISLPIKTNFEDFKAFNINTNKIYAVSTDGVKATLDNCVINKHGGEDNFFDCNLAKNKQFKDKGGKDDDHAREFIIHFNVTDNFTVATKYELHLVKGEFLSLSFTLLFLFLGILF